MTNDTTAILIRLNIKKIIKIVNNMFCSSTCLCYYQPATAPSALPVERWA